MKKNPLLITLVAATMAVLMIACSAPKKWDVPTTLGLKVGMKVEECKKAMDKLANSNPEKASEVRFSAQDSTYMCYIDAEKVFGRDFGELSQNQDATEVSCIISGGKVEKVSIAFFSDEPAKTMNKMIGSLDSGYGQTVKSSVRQAADFRNYIKGDRVLSFSFFQGKTFINYCDIKKFEEK